MNLSNLLSELQISRECALLGNYDSSLLYFESVLNTIQSHLKTLSDPLQKVSWTNTRHELLKEFTIIKEISQELNSFKERPGLGVHRTTSLWSEDASIGESPIPKRRNQSNAEIPGWATRLSSQATPSSQSKTSTKKKPLKNTPKKLTNTPSKQSKPVPVASVQRNQSTPISKKIDMQIQESESPPSDTKE